MGRVPCCDEMGMKKGPWTPEEDRILVSCIQKHGHGNWRALPKLAGLSRCGKSCRLRWTNYLRPDVKRGDFSREEEESIIYLHAMLGNRWSAIAAKLPGRTDNEIKNVWHTHLKKRLSPNQAVLDSQRRNRIIPANKETGKNKELEEQISPVSSQSHLLPSAIPREDDNNNYKDECKKKDFVNSLEKLLGTEDMLMIGNMATSRGWPEEEEEEVSAGERGPSSNEDDIRFWMNLLAEAGNLECFE